MAKFTWQRNLNVVMISVTTGMCAVMTQMSQAQRAQDKTPKSHCPSVKAA